MNMEVVVWRSCLQRPKDVVFKGFGGEGLVKVMENYEEGEQEEEM